VGIADQQKAGKLDRDDSIKQFSMQPHPTYLAAERNVGWSCVYQTTSIHLHQLCDTPSHAGVVEQTSLASH